MGSSDLTSNMLSLVKKSSLALIFKVLGALMTYLLSVVVVRKLGVDSSGVFFLVLTIFTIVAVLSRSGFDQVVLRFSAAYHQDNDNGALKSLLTKIFGMVFVISLAASLLMVMLSEPLSVKVFNMSQLSSPLIIMALAVVPYSLALLFSEALKGVGRTNLAIFIQNIFVPLSVVVVLFFSGGRPFGVTGVAVVYAIASLLLFGMCLVLYAGVTKNTKSDDSMEAGAIVMIAWPIFIATVMRMAISWSDTLMIGAWMDSASVSLYTAVAKSAMLINFILIAANTVLAPRFSQLYSANRIAELKKYYILSALIMTLVSAPLMLFFVVNPEFLLRIFDEAFVIGSAALIILAAGQFINVITGSVGYLLTMTGNEKVYRNIMVTAALINISLNVALIPAYGVSGAAFATSVSIAIPNIVAAIYAHKLIFTQTRTAS